MIALTTDAVFHASRSYISLRGCREVTSHCLDSKQLEVVLLLYGPKQNVKVTCHVAQEKLIAVLLRLGPLAFTVTDKLAL